jgi:hypothetical protein
MNKAHAFEDYTLIPSRVQGCVPAPMRGGYCGRRAFDARLPTAFLPEPSRTAATLITARLSIRWSLWSSG